MSFITIQFLRIAEGPKGVVRTKDLYFVFRFTMWTDLSIEFFLELGAGPDTGRHFRSALPAGTEAERLFSDRHLPDLMPDPMPDLFRSGMGSGMGSGK